MAGAEDEAAALIRLLEEAGATLLALPNTGYGPGLRQSSLPIIREAAECHATGRTTLRAPVPSAARISRMDRAFAAIQLIPESQILLRRVVGCRALVHPVTGRHLYAWRRLATLLDTDHKTIQRWHAQGIDLILYALRVRAASARPLPSASLGAGRQATSPATL